MIKLHRISDRLKGGEDKSSYAYLVLDNGIKVLLSRRADADKGAAAISVGVGGYEDPAEYPGMAHFLEHMLFMGTEKHPDENHYMEFLHLRNGSSNAYTSSEFTCYYYDVNFPALKESLDVFSGFFACPLLREDAVQREVHAVDSEHNRNVLLEDWRKEHLLTLLSKEGCPQRKFQTGSLRTLKGDALREEVHRFWEENYSSDKMCLAVHGREEFEDLAEYAAVAFASVPARPAKKPAEKDFFTFDAQYTGKIVKYRPAVVLNTGAEKKTLTIYVTLPESITSYREKIPEYIRFLLRGTGDTSLSAVLISMNLAFKVGISLEKTTWNTILSVSVDLTPLGAKEYPVIKEALSTYLELAKASSSEATYKMFEKIRAMEFENLESVNPIEFAPAAASALQLYPAEEFVYHEYNFSGYNADAFERTMRLALEKERWIHTYLTDDYLTDDYLTDHPTAQPKAESCEGQDEVYGISYRVGEYPEASACLLCEVTGRLRWPFGAEMGSCDVRELRKQCALSHKREAFGEFPVNVEKISFADAVKSVEKCKAEEAAEAWRFLPLAAGGGVVSSGVQDDFGEMRYVFNEKYSAKETHLLVALNTQEFARDPRTYASFIGYLHAFIGMFKERYRAEMSAECVDVSFVLKPFSVWFRFAGMPRMLESFVGLFFSEYTRQSICTLALSAGRAEKYFQAEAKESPWSLVYKGLQRKYGCPAHDPLVCLEELKSLDSLYAVKSAHVNALVTGNAEFAEAMSIYKTIRSRIMPAKLTLTSLKSIIGDAQEREVGRGDGDGAVYVRTEDDKNHGVGCFLEVSDSHNLRLLARALLLAQLRSEAFFDELRTKEKFGYVVSMGVFFLEQSTFVGYVVQSQRPPAAIAERISQFRRDGRAFIEGLPEEQFESHRQSTILSINEDINGVEEYAMDVFYRWSVHGFDLSFRKRLTEEVEQITKQDLLELEDAADKAQTLVYALHSTLLRSRHPMK